MTLTLPELGNALTALEAAKAAESEAILRRHEAERAVLAIVGELPAEGTRRFEAAGLVAVVQTGSTLKVDAARLAEIAPHVPEAIGKRLIRWKPEVSAGEWKYLRSNEPELYGVLATAIESKPTKPSIKLEPAKQKDAA